MGRRVTELSEKPIFVISPKHTTLDFPNDLTLNDKIEIFVARIEGWQIGIAKEIISRKIPDRGFAILQIVFCYFEMLGKYVHGYLGEDKSKYYFDKGFAATFPNAKEEQELFKILYTSVRNGLYHIGMTKLNVMLTDDIPGSIGFAKQYNLLKISPDKLVNDIDIRFHAYVDELRDPRYSKLRHNFELRFDFDN
jgi:hypothetical protein